MPLKIKSVSGSVTLDAQNVSGDQTLTVPSIAGGKTLLTTDGDGSSLTGVGDLSFGGDTFGADKTIGSNDNYALSFETNNTERLKITNDGRGLSQFTAKSWINMNGQGTISIRDSHNVSSISDENSGYYTVSFANNLGNGNYSVVATANNGANTANTDCGASPGSTASYVIDTWESTNASRSDFAIVCAAVFGD